MTILCICIDLRESPEMRFKSVVTAIHGLGSIFMATETTFLVKTNLTPNEVCEILSRQTQTAEEKILIFTVAVGEEWTLFGSEEDESAAVWMQNHVKQH